MKLIQLAVLLLAGLFGTVALASDNIKFNGFASIVSGIDLSDENAKTDYNNTTFDNLQESRVGLQLTAQLEDGVRFVGQAVGRGNAASGFVSNYEWAYFDFNVGSGGKFRAGRIRIPFYKYSNYLDVGYAYHWITPPESMYSLSFNNVDGFGFVQNFQMGGIESTINAVYGRYQGELFISPNNPVQSELRNLGSVNWSFTMGDHEFYIAYAQADVDVPDSDAAALAAGADTLGLDGDKVLINHDYGYFTSVGYKGTFGDLSIFMEANDTDVPDSAFSKSNGGYVGVAYSMSDYLVHITYEQETSEEKSFSDAAADADIGNGTSINSNLLALGNGDANAITIGVRKDIGFSTALKGEVTQYTEDRVQTAVIGAESEELTGTYVKFAVEAMF